MSDWTPDKVRERLTNLGLAPTATDEDLADVIEEVVTREVPAAVAVEPEPSMQPEPEAEAEAEAEEVTIADDGDEPLPELPPELIGKPCRCLDPNCTIPYGICHCGCGERTQPYTSTDTRAGRQRGLLGLAKQHHTLNKVGGGPAMPFLAEARRASGYYEQRKTATEATESAHTRSRKSKYGVSEDEHFERLCRLYDAFEVHATPEDREVRVSAFDAMLEAGSRYFGRRATTYGAGLMFKDLVRMGCIKTRGPQRKLLIRHPREARGLPPVETPAVVEAENAPASAPAPVAQTHETMIAAVSAKEMADALANAMWTRYEWALSELGRLSALVSTLTDENNRLTAILGDTRVDASEAARRILTDATN